MKLLFLPLFTILCQWQFLVISSQTEQRTYQNSRHSFQRTIDQILDDEDIESSGFDGSGEPPPEPEYSIYRCRIKLVDVIYDRSYSNRESQIFKDLSSQLTKDFTKIFPSTWRGSIKISVVQIRPSSDINTIVSIDIAAIQSITSQGIVLNIKKSLESGTLGAHRVSSQEFFFGTLADGNERDGGEEIICNPTEFRCTNGQCIKGDMKCNQIYDCLDRSDENDCLTSSIPETVDPSTFPTSTNSVTQRSHHSQTTQYPTSMSGEEYRITVNKGFDGSGITTHIVPDCPYKCQSDGRCLSLSSRCDGRYDCTDGSDEARCDYLRTTNTPPLPTTIIPSTTTPPTTYSVASCHQAEFTCLDGTCIDGRLKCNYIIDCPDASDERDCAIPTQVFVKIEPPYARIFQGAARPHNERFLTIKCIVNGTASYTVSWNRDEVREGKLPPSARQINQDLLFDYGSLNPSDAGTYRCVVDVDDDQRLGTTPNNDVAESADHASVAAIFRIDVIPRESTLAPDLRDHVSMTIGATTTPALVSEPKIVKQSYQQERINRYEEAKKEYELKKEAYYRSRTSSLKPREAERTTPGSYPPSSFSERTHRPILTNTIAHHQSSSPPVEIFVRPREVEIEEGGSTTIEAHVRTRNRNVRSEDITWSRLDGKPLAQGRIYQEYNGRRFVIRDSQLSDAGIYLCTVLVKYYDTTSPTSLEERVVVGIRERKRESLKPGHQYVRGGEGSVQHRPAVAVPQHSYGRYNPDQRTSLTTSIRLRVEPSDLTLSYNEDARFRCEIMESSASDTNNNERDEINWVRLSGPGAPKVPEKSQVSGTELRIPGVGREDQGHYACTLKADPSVRSVATLRVYPTGHRVAAAPPSQPSRIPPTAVDISEIQDHQQKSQEMQEGDKDDEEEEGEEDYETEKRSPTANQRKNLYRCEMDEATCQNGECIKRQNVCDGIPNCSDGSDERNCPGTSNMHRDGNFQKYCEPNEYRCDNGRCVQKIWRCDGDDDCGDSSDERNCATNPPGSACKFTEYRCHSLDQCIPSSYQCDGEIDCQDRSDEIGCSPPIILEPPPRDVIAKLGGTVEITCLSRGTPVPLISWRLNWGHVPIAPRISSTSANGRGVLTIRNVQLSDQGAYSCEAINNRDSILATPDAILIIEDSGRPSGEPGKAIRPICQPPYFKNGARSEGECLVCYCSGRTTQCYSSDNLYLSEITLRTPVTSIKVDGQPTPIQALPDGITIQSTGRTSSPPQYAELPQEFLGNRLKSYGSALSLIIHYTVQNGRHNPEPRNKYATLILEGSSNQKIYYHIPNVPQPGTPNKIDINIKEKSFSASPDPNYGTRVDRQTLMTILKNVVSIKLLVTYSQAQTQISVTKISMGDAVNYDNRKGKAILVEECRCPPGYSGLSCESCSPGYNLVILPGQTLGSCISCSCNGHSSQCDPSSKACLNCQHNTEGNQCERCKSGYFGNALAGGPDACRPCSCPMTVPTNNFSPSCKLDSDNQMTCTQCPQGFSGRRCESCSGGYIGNPNVIGDTCQIPHYTQPPYQSTPSRVGPCSPIGALSTTPDRQSGSCSCKSQTTGLTCNSCKPNAFHLAPENPNGCIGCFCMGVTNDCQSCRLYKSQQRTDLTQPQNRLQLSSLLKDNRHSLESLGINKSPSPSPTGFVEIRLPDTTRTPTIYWELPQILLGNRVTSYGGSLSYALEVNGQGNINTDPDVEISGNNIHLLYDGNERVNPNQLTQHHVKFFENLWKREDGTPATREQLLMALAGLNRILIKATYFNSTSNTKIKDIFLDVASERDATSRDIAHSVEQCKCPHGYKGTSCEECAQGYTRTDGGLYLGQCRPCSCSRRSNLCHPQEGTCQNCENSEGQHCERCKVGFYGYQDSPCLPCPCPIVAGQPSLCQIDPNDNQITCNNCPPGTSGRRCDKCILPFVPDPNDPENCYIPPTPLPYPVSNPRPLDTRISLTVQEPRHAIVNEGEIVTFICKVHADDHDQAHRTSSSNLEWSKQGGPLPINTENVNGVLRIRDAKTQDSGIYICKGRNDPSVQTTARLDVRGRRYEPLKVYIAPTLINANAGDSGAFRCNIQGMGENDDSLKIKWYKHNGNLPESHRIDGRVLNFQNVVDSDSGLYVCEVSGPAGHYRSTARLLVEFTKDTTYHPSTMTTNVPTTNAVYSTPTVTPYIPPTLNFNTPPKSEMVPPSIIAVRPRELTLGVGSSTTLTCEITGDPLPSVTWVKKGGEEIGPNHQMFRNKLRLLSVAVEDSGIYMCRATNAMGSAQGQIVVDVKAPQPPTLSVSPSRSQNLKIGGNAQFECGVAPGESSSSVTWVRLGDKEIIKESTQISDRFLRFRNVNGKEKGNYQCSATNSAGTSRQLVTLMIEGIPLVTITPTSPVKVLEGDVVSFECTAEGDPLPSVQWVVPKHIEVENPLEENQETRRGDIPSASAIFEITHVEKKDAGKYSCLARNALGETEETLELIVEESAIDIQMDPSRSIKIKPVKIEPESQNLNSGQTAQLNCIVSGHSQYKIEWKRAGGYMLSKNSYTAVDGHKLIIPNLASKDKGEYLCYVNLANGGYLAAKSRLNVITNIDLSVSPSVQTVEQGHTFRIACSGLFKDRSSHTATTSHFIKLHWYKKETNGGLVPLRPGAIDYSGLLEVKSASPADSGVYLCTATHSDGTPFDGNSISAQVNVVERNNQQQTHHQNIQEVPISSIPNLRNGVGVSRETAYHHHRETSASYTNGYKSDGLDQNGKVFRYSLQSSAPQQSRVRNEEALISRDATIRDRNNYFVPSNSFVKLDGNTGVSNQVMHGQHDRTHQRTVMAPSLRKIDRLQIERPWSDNANDANNRQQHRYQIFGNSANHSGVSDETMDSNINNHTLVVERGDRDKAAGSEGSSHSFYKYEMSIHSIPTSLTQQKLSPITINLQDTRRQNPLSQIRQRPSSSLNAEDMSGWKASSGGRINSVLVGNENLRGNSTPMKYSQLSQMLFHPRTRNSEDLIKVTPGHIMANEGSEVELLCQFLGNGYYEVDNAHNQTSVGPHQVTNLERAPTVHGWRTNNNNDIYQNLLSREAPRTLFHRSVLTPDTPDIKYTWTKVNEKMPNEFSRINGLLRIKNIKKTDSGSYSCKIKARGYPVIKKEAYIYVVPNDNRFRRGTYNFGRKVKSQQPPHQN